MSEAGNTHGGSGACAPGAAGTGSTPALAAASSTVRNAACRARSTVAAALDTDTRSSAWTVAQSAAIIEAERIVDDELSAALAAQAAQAAIPVPPAVGGQPDDGTERSRTDLAAASAARVVVARAEVSASNAGLAAAANTFAVDSAAAREAFAAAIAATIFDSQVAAAEAAAARHAAAAAATTLLAARVAAAATAAAVSAAIAVLPTVQAALEPTGAAAEGIAHGVTALDSATSIEMRLLRLEQQLASAVADVATSASVTAAGSSIVTNLAAGGADAYGPVLTGAGVAIVTTSTATNAAAGVEAPIDVSLATGEPVAGTVQVGATARPRVVREIALGTHQVCVLIDEATGEYALECQSCNWESARGAPELHSWSERMLDTALLYHVDFGGLGDDTASPQAAIRNAVDAAMLRKSAALDNRSPRETPRSALSRRGMFGGDR